MGYLVVPQRFEGAVVTLAGMVDVTMKIGVEMSAEKFVRTGDEHQKFSE